MPKATEGDKPAKDAKVKAVKPKKADGKPVAVKAPARAAAAPKKAVAAPKKAVAAPKKAAVAPKRAAAKKEGAETGGRVPTAEQRRYYVEVAAYYIAERRGFDGGGEFEDWVRAEAEIDRLLREGILKP